MEILLWLVPSAVVTVVAMLWVGWLGREGRGVVDRDEALRRMARALGDDDPRRRTADPRPRYVARRVDPDPSGGVATRPSRSEGNPPLRRAG